LQIKVNIKNSSSISIKIRMGLFLIGKRLKN
jgi:hypothetical protein